MLQTLCHTLAILVLIMIGRINWSTNLASQIGGYLFAPFKEAISQGLYNQGAAPNSTIQAMKR